MEYTSKAVGNAALTTGIIGTALGVIDGAGGITGLFGNRRQTPPPDPGDRPVTRHEMELYQQINDRDFKIARLEGMSYTDHAAQGLQQQICQQTVWNATQTAVMQCMQGQIAQLQSMTKLVIPNSSVAPGWGGVDIYPVAPPLTVAAATSKQTDTTPTNNGG